MYKLVYLVKHALFVHDFSVFLFKSGCIVAARFCSLLRLTMNKVNVLVVQTRYRDCWDEWRPSKRHLIASQPAVNTTSNAEQLAKKGGCLQVAYIHCPRSSWNRTPDVVSIAIKNAIEIGSTIISLIFDSQVDVLIGGLRPILGDLELEDRWRTTTVGTILSMYSTDSW